MFKQVTVFIKGYYGPRNIGDDALMIVLSNLIKEVCPVHKIGIGVMNSQIANSWLPGIQFFNTRDSQKIRAKILVYGGGGQFFSFPLTHSGKSNFTYYVKTLANLLRNLRSPEKIYAGVFGRKGAKAKFRVDAERVAAFCVGVGPFVPNSPGLDLAKSILVKCDYLSVRDIESQEICQSWGINGVRKTTDACYLKDLWMNRDPLPQKKHDLNKAIGFIVRHWPHTDIGEQYIDSMLVAAQKLKKLGFVVHFISLDNSYDEPIFSKLKKQNVAFTIYDPSKTKPDVFMQDVVSNFDLVVSSRAHGIILSAALGMPGVCAEIEPKLTNVHRMLPTGTCLWKKPFDPIELVKIVQTICSNFQAYSDNIHIEADKNYRIAKKESEYFIHWLKSAYDPSYNKNCL